MFTSEIRQSYIAVSNFSNQNGMMILQYVVAFGSVLCSEMVTLSTRGSPNHLNFLKRDNKKISSNSFHFKLVQIILHTILYNKMLILTVKLR